MTNEEYENAKKPILDKLYSESKDKGLDVWKKVLKHYGVSVEKAKHGFYLQGQGNVHLYFDDQQDKWLMRPANPEAN